MSNRIMVKAYAGDHGIDLRTVNRNTKSPHLFYVPRSVLSRLEREPYIVTHDIYSFATLSRDSYRGTLEIRFTWLRGNERALTGREETVILPYDRFMEFVKNSTQEDGPKTWRALSMDVSHRTLRPRKHFTASLKMPQSAASWSALLTHISAGLTAIKSAFWLTVICSLS